MKRPPQSLLMLLMLAGLTHQSAVAEEIYRYIDPKGRLILTSTPKYKGYIKLEKTPDGWVPSYEIRVDPKVRKALSPLIQEAANRYRLPYHLIHAVISVESSYNTEAVSSAGAKGLMQLMPDTASRFGVENVFNPRENINAGSEYLSYLLKEFNGDYQLALAAYNAGENTVRRFGNRIPPFRETENYVQKVMSYYRNYRSSGNEIGP